MCSFTQESLVCSNCGQLLSTSSTLFKTCDPKPSKHCKTYKRRATVRRYAPAEECNGCSRRMFDEEMELLEAMEEERMRDDNDRVRQMETAGEDSGSSSEQEAGEDGEELTGMGLASAMHSAGFHIGWREVKL